MSLEEKEYDVLWKNADRTEMDCWFSVCSGK
jgi:hypothetical protein